MSKKDKKIIENSERESFPIFVLSAKDVCSLDAMRSYYNSCIEQRCSVDHLNAIVERIAEFEAYQEQNCDNVKIPD